MTSENETHLESAAEAEQNTTPEPTESAPETSEGAAVDAGTADEPVAVTAAPTEESGNSADTDAKSISQIEQEMADEFIVDEATDEVLRLHLDKFEGPFEVLLYLIKAQEIDIFDIPISRITEQYLRFLEFMREENLDVAGDFLVMAATLVQIKSKMVLPIEVDEEEEEFEEEDPRLELVEKLIEYRKFKDVTKFLERMEEERTNWFERNAKVKVEQDPNEEEVLEVTLYDLIKAFKGVLRYISDDLSHNVETEGHSIDEKIEEIEQRLEATESVAWSELFEGCRSKVELVCYFLAILELCKMRRIRAYQQGSFGEIRVFLRKGDEENVEGVAEETAEAVSS